MKWDSLLTGRCIAEALPGREDLLVSSIIDRSLPSDRRRWRSYTKVKHTRRKGTILKQDCHIYNHDVDEEEVGEVLESPGEDRPGRDGSRVALGQTRGGRFLRVIYVRDPQPDSVFVVTAYDLRGKLLLAYRRRLRKKGR
jgi:uncharacterized protein DUF4258